VTDHKIQEAYHIARERFQEEGIDTEATLRVLNAIPISIQCWQGDDVLGFENPNGTLSGGIQTTGNYPGRARNAQELRADFEVALSLIPGTKRANLHAIYLESDSPVARDAIQPEHFRGWVEWAGGGRHSQTGCRAHGLRGLGLRRLDGRQGATQQSLGCEAQRQVASFELRVHRPAVAQHRALVGAGALPLRPPAVGLDLQRVAQVVGADAGVARRVPQSLTPVDVRAHGGIVAYHGPPVHSIR